MSVLFPLCKEWHRLHCILIMNHLQNALLQLNDPGSKLLTMMNVRSPIPVITNSVNAFACVCCRDAGRSIETVLIPVVREGGQRNRITICVSTQVGCAMNCQVSR